VVFELLDADPRARKSCGTIEPDEPAVLCSDGSCVIASATSSLRDAQPGCFGGLVQQLLVDQLADRRLADLERPRCCENWSPNRDR